MRRSLRTKRGRIAAGRGRQRARTVGKPHSSARMPRQNRSRTDHLSEADLRWAEVQKEEAAAKVEDLQRRLRQAERDHAARSALADKMAEVGALRATAAEAEEEAGKRGAEAEERAREADLAKEAASIAARRKKEGEAALKRIREKERALSGEAVKMQRAISSRDTSETASEDE